MDCCPSVLLRLCAAVTEPAERQCCCPSVLLRLCAGVTKPSSTGFKHCPATRPSGPDCVCTHVRQTANDGQRVRVRRNWPGVSPVRRRKNLPKLVGSLNPSRRPTAAAARLV